MHKDIEWKKNEIILQREAKFIVPIYIYHSKRSERDFTIMIFYHIRQNNKRVTSGEKDHLRALISVALFKISHVMKEKF